MGPVLHFDHLFVKRNLIALLFVGLSRMAYSRTSIARTPMARLPWLIRIVFESLRNSSDSSRKQTIKEISLFYNDVVCCLYSLENPHRGDSNEYIPHTIIISKIEKKFAK